MKRHCERCGKEFVAQRSTAKYCSASCRASATVERASGVAAVTPIGSREPGPSESGFIASVRERVVSAGLEDSPEGLLAIRLAMAVEANDDGSKLAALARQFNAQMDRIESLVPRVTQVDELRRRRDRKRARPA